MCKQKEKLKINFTWAKNRIGSHEKVSRPFHPYLTNLVSLNVLYQANQKIL